MCIRDSGAHVVVSPEEEMGERLARRLAQPNVLERVILSSAAEVAEVEAPADFLGKTLIELDVRRKYGLSVVAIRRGDSVLAPLEDRERMAPGDVLVVIGTSPAIARLAARV